MLGRDQFRIVDDWQVMGMRGTGSKRVVAEDVWVPARRTAPTAGLGNVTQVALPGPRIYDNPMYFGRIGAFLIGEAASVAVGAARGALDLYEEVLRSKRAPFPPYLERHKDPEFQHHYGRALALIATAEAALIRAGEDYMEYAREDAAGVPFNDEKDQRLTLIEQQCIALAWQAIDLIYRTVGTSAAVKEGQPIGRVFRNIAAINTHPALQIDRTAINAARTRFGLPRGPAADTVV
jgi:3-hydroxy-9,10-secoandrosta-1,3,5(10)-triene-9,17-dione monooxygenase